MRRVLILGGNAWLGRELAQRFMERGDAVTCLARGDSGPPPAGASFIESDRLLPGAYSAVAGRSWDEVIELGYEATLVSGALAALGAAAEHWTLISSVSVYAGNSTPGADESAALVEPVGAEDYAGAKAAAERMSSDSLGDRLLIVRPGLLAGPGDVSDRFGYWPARFALAGNGPVLVPEQDGRYVQVLEAADLASWLAAASVEGLTGVFNAAGDIHPLREVLTLAAETAGFRGEMVSAPENWLLEKDVRYWAGPRSMPLWLPAVDAGFAQRSNAAFHAAGGHVSELDQTLDRVLADERQRGLDRPRASGLTRAEELELLGLLAAERACSRPRLSRCGLPRGVARCMHARSDDGVRVTATALSCLLAESRGCGSNTPRGPFAVCLHARRREPSPSNGRCALEDVYGALRDSDLLRPSRSGRHLL
ncbi:NAD-dependent epimerase/dehydratase family protein [Arthrobacter gallicola]|uniref:NAD-dependent epimerase/dehydratase family protein n=1 Tax=Arthrobacter gallicola TaxID=2762225 RepID=UPI00296AAD03|nr:NAD-dependent epimerase/dehydratase family protein [Arthrobacter gallicola]